jgi:hypothetical protein
MGGNALVKVNFKLDPADGHGFDTESVWAERVGPSEFRLKNSPFFVFGVSFEDVVEAKKLDDDDQILEFRSVISRGGHSTYRIYLLEGRKLQSEEFMSRWTSIEALGATYENGSDRIAAVDIPPGSNVNKIYRLLEAGEEAGVWEFEEGHFQSSPAVN